ncbi:MAG TPA: hypothetical protein VF677_10825 [Flavobacterium sp.]
MESKITLESIYAFFKYDYDTSIRKLICTDFFEIHHSYEGFCLNLNRNKNILLFEDGKGNKWMYTGRTEAEYECEEYNYKALFLSGSTFYDNGKSIKHTQSAEEIFNVAAKYFSGFIKSKVDVFVAQNDNLYQAFPIELFSPICHYKYKSPIIVLNGEAGYNYLDYCVKMANKKTKAGFSEAYTPGRYISFTDDNGNCWMYDESGETSFAKITEDGHEFFRIIKGETYYNEELNIYKTFTLTKEEVYARAIDYFSKYIHKPGLIKYLFDLTEINNN